MTTTPTTATLPVQRGGRPAAPRRGRRLGVVLTALTALFLLFDGVSHLARPQVVLDATAALGYTAGAAVVMGVVQLVCLALYLVPRTAVLGAVLLTGYLGGAVAAQLRIEAPLGSTLLFPVYVGVLVWLALWLRDDRVRGLLGPR